MNASFQPVDASPAVASICVTLMSAEADDVDCAALRRSLAARGATVHDWPLHADGGLGRPPAGTDVVLIAARILDVRVAALIRQISSGPKPFLIVVSDTEDITDRILALELGADDLVRRDCDPREILARTRSLMRRHAQRDDRSGRFGGVAAEVLDGWTLNELTRTLRSPSGAICELSRGDVELINALVDEQDAIFAADADSTVMANRIRVSISRLRRRVRRVSADPFPIRNVRGEGYTFDGRLERVSLREPWVEQAA